MSVPKRLLALEVRASKLGFAVLEGSARLLDWGVRSFGEQNKEVQSALSDRIITLLAFHNPSTVVVRVRKYHSAFHNRKFLSTVAAIKAETKRNTKEFCVLTIQQVRDHFALRGQITKDDIATSLANQFEEISWKLPRRRKAFQSEARAMLVFDALANGITFVERQIPRSFSDERKS
jgi:hypothetical protein